jgi:hypothetical protein
MLVLLWGFGEYWPIHAARMAIPQEWWQPLMLLNHRRAIRANRLTISIHSHTSA